MTRSARRHAAEPTAQTSKANVIQAQKRVSGFECGSDLWAGSCHLDVKPDFVVVFRAPLLYYETGFFCGKSGPCRDPRNALAHGYFNVDLGIVWTTIQGNLPDLYAQAQDVLTSLRNQDIEGMKP